MNFGRHSSDCNRGCGYLVPGSFILLQEHTQGVILRLVPGCEKKCVCVGGVMRSNLLSKIHTDLIFKKQ